MICWVAEGMGSWKADQQLKSWTVEEFYQIQLKRGKQFVSLLLKI